MRSHGEPTPAEIQAGLNGVVRDMLCPAALMLAVAHLCYTAAHAINLPPGSREVMMSLDGATTLMGLGLLAYFVNVEIPASHANRWAGLMLGLALANFASQIYFTPHPSLTVFLVLLMVAAGCFLLSWAWLTAAIVGSLAVWGEGIFLNPAGDWWGIAHIVLVGGLLGILVHWIRWRTYSQYERLKLQLQRTTLRLKYRLEFEQILTRISTRFLALSREEIDQEVALAMQAVGQQLEVDHVCVCRVEGTPSTLSLMHEWCRPGVAPRKQRMQQVPTTCLPWCWQRLKADENVQITRLEDLIDEAQTDKAFLEQNGIRSFVAVPLAIDGGACGLLGLASEQREVHWSKDTASLLRVLGEIIVASLKRKEAEEEISHLNVRLEQASRLVGLGEMAANLAHDLVNGLSSILQFTQGARRRADRGSLTLEKCFECLEDIQEQANYMRVTLMTIQQFVRTRTSERIPIQLPTVLKQSELLVRGKFRQRGIQLHFSDPPEIPTLLADPAQIMIVMMNLLLNAAQAMADCESGKRCITVTLHNDRPDFVEVSIRDRGPGVPPELKEKIFDKFYTTKTDGLGLGLAFSRSYIQQHGGQLWCEPHSNTGCEFRFTLPISTASF